jgi:serine/threonine protein kinase/tetratricopeptide (TPR) repeat protein
MSPDTAKEEAIFDAAIQIEDTAARAVYLDDACGGDATLRAAVDELLRFHDTKDDLLAKPVAQLARSAGELAEQPGTVIGRYRIVERIGEGGFGSVYRAEQIEPVRRDVALKILKPGMDSREIIARFDAERQALAMMSHPTIATVLDAGATPAGRPYFVMELVAGPPIDEYCDAARMPVPDRLRVFLSVCRALQHAHQKGLVHRDLKPSNVLIASDAVGQAVPKVIDFGIAKALHQPAAASATRDLKMLLGTPEYMSPEQVAMAGDVDTRADIYALGGVLYKLLTGSTPLDSDTLRRQDFTEVCRAIREVDPPPPSQRVVRWLSDPTRTDSSKVGTESQPTVADRRSTNPTSLRRMLRGDLDWIVMKSLEKDCSRRYETVSELAADIERFLNHEPVSAGPPSAWYRASKFVRRNCVAVAAAAAVSLAIVAGGAAATIGFVRAKQQAQIANQQKQAAETARGEADARRVEAENARQQADVERARAVAESEKANRVVTLLEELLGSANPDMGHPADFTVRQLLDEFAQSQFESLADQPEVEATLRRTIGRAYWQIGDMPRAGPQLERALELSRRMYQPGDPRIIDSQVDFARYLVQVARFDEAHEMIQPALESARSESPRDAHIWAAHVLARIHNVRGRHADAEASFQHAIDLSRRVHGEHHLTTLWLQPFLVYTAWQRRDFARAESLGRQLLAEQTEILGDDHAITARTRCWLAHSLIERGQKAEEADRMLRRSLETHRKQLGSESADVVHDLVALSAAQRALRRPAEAERFAREAVAIADRIRAERDYLRVLAYRALGMPLRATGPAAAAESFQRAIDAQRGIAPDQPIMTALLLLRAASLREIGQADEAAECLREASDVLRRHAHDLSRGHGTIDSEPREIAPEVVLYYLACTERQRGDLAAADRLLREAAETCDPSRADRPLAWIDWIDVLLERHDSATPADAATHLEQITAAARQLAAFHSEAPNTINRVGADLAAAALELARGNLDAAEPLIQSSFESARKAGLLRALGRSECLRADILFRRQRFQDAERLLLVLDRAARAQSPFQVDDVLLVTRRLVKLYEAWEKPDEAAKWRERPPTRTP